MERMIRIGVDFGGSKIEAAAIDSAGAVLARVREPNSRIYDASLAAVARVVAAVEAEVGAPPGAPVGVGMPGSLSPLTGLIRNANSQWLAGRAFPQDLERTLERPVRVSNDANCFALSEARGGAGEAARVVFGAILGTGCGGGVVVGGDLVEGANLIAGEWGHSPLPWPAAEERAAHLCWCGRVDCLETWISGTAFAADYVARGGEALAGDAIMARARAGEARAKEAFALYLDRLARGLAVLCDLIDPDVIVLGGGMSNISELYEALPPLVSARVFSDVFVTPIVPARFGDSSGARAAAWLWP